MGALLNFKNKDTCCKDCFTAGVALYTCTFQVCSFASPTSPPVITADAKTVNEAIIPTTVTEAIAPTTVTEAVTSAIFLNDDFLSPTSKVFNDDLLSWTIVVVVMLRMAMVMFVMPEHVPILSIATRDRRCCREDGF